MADYLNEGSDTEAEYSSYLNENHNNIDLENFYSNLPANPLAKA